MSGVRSSGRYRFCAKCGGEFTRPSNCYVCSRCYVASSHTSADIVSVKGQGYVLKNGTLVPDPTPVVVLRGNAETGFSTTVYGPA